MKMREMGQAEGQDLQADGWRQDVDDGEKLTSITTSGSDDIESISILGDRVDTIDVALERTDERLCKESVKLCSVEGSSVFYGFIEGMQ